MTRKRIFGSIFIAAALSAALTIASFAQGAPAASGVEAQSTQQEFRITPVRPIAELRDEALMAKPPEEPGPFAFSNLVELTTVDPSIHLDIRYATKNNFLGEPVYEEAQAFLQAPAAYALKRVSEELHEKGYGLLIYDAYRPWFVTKIFWDATPVDKREFVADPAQGSGHNRGCAVDLTLYRLMTEAAVTMPSDYDEMTPRSYADYAGASPDAREHRELLRKAMESEGFLQRPNEWWHYDYKDCRKYPILNLPFDEIETRAATPAKRLTEVEPKSEGEEGTVLLSIVIDEKGVPGDVRVVRSLGGRADEKAIAAVKQWRFEPGKIDGHPVPVMMQVKVNFLPSEQ